MLLSLTKEDKQFLFSKYIKNGLSKDEADFKIRNMTLHLRKLVDNLRHEKKSETDINSIFLEELEKLGYK